MPKINFDAPITLNDHHLIETALCYCPADTAASVRTAIEHIDGAGRIDVEAQYYPRYWGEWVVLYRPGRGDRLKTLEWQALQQKIEQTALAAFQFAGASSHPAGRFRLNGASFNRRGQSC